MPTQSNNKTLGVNDITPYFQVLVFKKEGYDRETFRKLIEQKVEKSQKINRTSKVRWENIDGRNYAAWIETKEFPSWLETIETIGASPYLPINIENSLILINDTNTYVYAHASDKRTEEILQIVFLNELKQSKVDIKIFYKALAELNLRIKSLGINNTFGAGGTAAEAKSYFGKDAKLSLTPSFDSGYSFSYCLGSSIDDQGNISTFGCSAKRRKFWSTWTDGVTDFADRCKEIDKMLKTKNKGEFIPFLVHPINVKKPQSLKLLGFYLDYVVQAKGVVTPIINKQEVHNWQCQVSESGNIQIGDTDNFTEIQITKLDNNNVELSYTNPQNIASIVISNDEKPLDKKRRTDLIEYLKKEENFTILFEEGYAFRERSFWQDNRLKTPFTKDIFTDISWSTVDIRKEDSKPDDPTKISIAQKTEEYLYSLIKDFEIMAIVKDGGANEAADHMVVCKNQIILIHEKYSAKNKPGLRIDDLQIVASQLIKNIRYLFPTAHDTQLDRFFSRAIYLSTTCNSAQELGNLILSALTNINVQNECWIVQPGISKTKLTSNTKNKFHVLLSHLNSICASNNTKFKLYCSG